MSFYSEKTIQIQKATPADAPALTSLARYAFLETYIPLAPHRKKEIEQYVAKDFTLLNTELALQDPAVHFFVMKALFLEETLLLGYAKLNTALSTPSIGAKNKVCIERFYIHPAHKNRGLGAQLMKTVLKYIRQQGIKIVWLTVWDVNLAVIDFYERFGFRQAGVHLFDMGDTIDEDILMVLEV